MRPGRPAPGLSRARSYSYPGPADQGCTIGLVLFAGAAWTRGRPTGVARNMPGVRAAAVPAVFAAAGLAVLLLAARSGLNVLDVGLAAGCLVAVVVRLLSTLLRDHRLPRCACPPGRRRRGGRRRAALHAPPHPHRERIVAAAPALVGVAPLGRSSHER